jgi:hypothetical protein
MSETVLEEAVRRFAWAWPPESDKDDARDAIKNEKRAAQGKKLKPPRDWDLTRTKALEQINNERRCASTG